MEYDLWICRHGSSVWFAWAYPDDAPMMFPQRAKSVKEAFKWLKWAGIKIGQVGIADKEMLGLD